jgi:hypothetical protein
MWETFRGPGPTDQVMLPPQPSPDVSSAERKVSFEPLQLMDSNVVLPYQGKGKGRARDFNLAQQFTAWEEANMGGAGSFDVSGGGINFVPQQELRDPPFHFTFVPGQFEAWQPTNTTHTQPQVHRRCTNTQAQNPQVLQNRTSPSTKRRQSSTAQLQNPQVRPTRLLPSIDPPVVPIAQLRQAPAADRHLQAQLPLQQAFRPPPGFPQQPASPGRDFYPGSDIQQSYVETAQSPMPRFLQTPPGFPQQPASPGQTFYTGHELHQPHGETLQPVSIRPLPPVEIPMLSGYYFQPGCGFICNVCSACVKQPGIHRFEGQNFWCYADGPEMRLDDEVNMQRWPKRAKMDLYVP